MLLKVKRFKTPIGVRFIRKMVTRVLLQSDKTKIAVLRLQGVIGQESNFKTSLTLDNLEEHIVKAFKIKNVKAVALVINSPGGSPVQSELIYRRIRMLSEEHKIPVYSFAEDCAASGGYWLACAGDEIYAMGSSLIGSIGVIAAGFGFVDAIKKVGVERRIYKQGENKALLDPFTPVRSEDVEVIMRAQAVIHGQFKNLVRNRRGNKIKGVDEKELFSGEFWCGADAVAKGLVDELGDMHTVLQQKFGLELQLIKVNKPVGWLKRKLGMSLHSAIEAVFDVAKERQLWAKLGL
jgi:signal peptide peptidase SppA